MPDHTVLLNYNGATFTPAPNPIRVKAGQTIHFRLGEGPAGGQIRITFNNPAFFSAPAFHTGDPDIRVAAAPAATTYHCELLLNGQLVAQSSEGAGGDIVPDSTT